MTDHAARKAYELLDAGKRIVVATVRDTEGSVPRHAGSFMVVSEEGDIWGSVGGGKFEAAAMKEAQELFESSVRNRVIYVTLRMAGKGALGMVCGGSAHIDLTLYDRSNAADLDLEEETITTAYLFGAGHVGAAIEPVVRSVGFRTVVVDDRPEFANASRFPDADRVVVAESYQQAFDDLDLDENSYIVICTRGHMEDLDVLRGAIHQPHAYLGLMGSRRKIAFLFGTLRNEGVSKELLDDVHTPIGLPIEAETPAELAISIVAELIQERARNLKSQSDKERTKKSQAAQDRVKNRKNQVASSAA
ncbi:XdhC family protein [Adlercreutzia sp. ZJ138]|uniref:XdhC family protein n=1 Tax=Adlercreutzia sp. ZJ138 TaxID=2709405 RepID=UPI0013EC52AE|nr:XdhC/CoxI family protein [Adlercreutzia sp. ZJ138]